MLRTVLNYFLEREIEQEKEKAEYVAEGVIGGLSVMTAATLLRTIGLRTWHQILMFTLILFLRILLKKLFVWEKQRLFQDPA